jgi:hypothetical protein
VAKKLAFFKKTSWSGEDPFTVLTNTDIHLWGIVDFTAKPPLA